MFFFFYILLLVVCFGVSSSVCQFVAAVPFLSPRFLFCLCPPASTTNIATVRLCAGEKQEVSEGRRACAENICRQPATIVTGGRRHTRTPTGERWLPPFPPSR
ncbi:hypothetical protein TRSC58_07279 [Trypanosoma rangeli SC58]|uniref:Secreted protein n=1 Tax=Trypanosoma rangeli SC58 TaxID=429131 RepID=A0A061IRQ6_TRYRA|nr:hypothetical protein TRSC58_07279 [Trypanosoma rangeli SC58]